VHLQVRNTATIAERLLHHEIDLGLVEGQVVDAELHVEPWVEDELVVFCAPGHALAARGRASVAELAGQPWILRERGSGTRETFDRALRHHPGGVVPRLELEHTEAIKRAVESGLGLGCLSRLALRDAFRRGSLVAVEVPELDLRRRFSFVWHRGKYHGAALRRFVEDCRAFTAGARRSDEIPLPPVA
jgi:DNA-binding transcriptional LysR family regulator